VWIFQPVHTELPALASFGPRPRRGELKRTALEALIHVHQPRRFGVPESAFEVLGAWQVYAHVVLAVLR
jgi:hypothetical protein